MDARGEGDGETEESEEQPGEETKGKVASLESESVSAAEEEPKE